MRAIWSRLSAGSSDAADVESELTQRPAVPECVLNWEPYKSRIGSEGKALVKHARQEIARGAFGEDIISGNSQLTTEILLLAGATAPVLHSLGVGVRASFVNDQLSRMSANDAAEHTRRRLCSFGLPLCQDLLREHGGSWSTPECIQLVAAQHREALRAGLGMATEATPEPVRRHQATFGEDRRAGGFKC